MARMHIQGIIASNGCQKAVGGADIMYIHSCHIFYTTEDGHCMVSKTSGDIFLKYMASKNLQFTSNDSYILV